MKQILVLSLPALLFLGACKKDDTPPVAPPVKVKAASNPAQPKILWWQ